MASRTAWVTGNGQGLTWGTLINSADLVGMTNGGTVMSTVSDIANGTNLDIYMDVSYLLTLATAQTVSSGANFAFWLYALNQDGTHYGDNQLTAGTQVAATPSFAPVISVGVPAVGGTTTMYGYGQGIIIPPGSFRIAVQNNSGFTLATSTQTVKYRTYNAQLNN